MVTYQKKTPINLYLVIVTVFFVLAGFAFSLSTVKTGINERYCWSDNHLYLSGEQINVSADSVCKCSEGSFSCRDIPKTDKREFGRSDFTNKNLTFTTKYLSPNIPNDISKNLLQVSFEGISVRNSKLEVTLHQVQYCTKDLKIASQVGRYNFSNNTLTLFNAINSISTLYNKQCLVELVYGINDIKMNDNGSFKLRFSNEKYETIDANICLYNSRIYSEGDKYVAIDKCNVCTCSNGVSKCSTNSCQSKK